MKLQLIRLLLSRLVVGLLVNLAACSSASQLLQAQALQLGLQQLSLSVQGYQLTGFYQPGSIQLKRLHVYLEGDGRPWQSGWLVTPDPTTRSSVMLPLMAMDDMPSLYLSRPCYNGHAEDSGCAVSLWTSARYGEQVVNIMTHALTEFCKQHGYQELVLIGHSGGGSLALLLAQRLPQTRLIISLAINYDIHVWADYHGYQRLAASLNPVDTRNNGIPEWHFLGQEDNNIPPQLNWQSLSQRHNSYVEIFPNVDHNHGWQQQWPNIMSRLKAGF